MFVDLYWQFSPLLVRLQLLSTDSLLIVSRRYLLQYHTIEIYIYLLQYYTLEIHIYLLQYLLERLVISLIYRLQYLQTAHFDNTLEILILVASWRCNFFFFKYCFPATSLDIYICPSSANLFPRFWRVCQPTKRLRLFHFLAEISPKALPIISILWIFENVKKLKCALFRALMDIKKSAPLKLEAGRRG